METKEKMKYPAHFYASKEDTKIPKLRLGLVRPKGYSVDPVDGHFRCGSIRTLRG